MRQPRKPSPMHHLLVKYVFTPTGQRIVRLKACTQEKPGRGSQVTTVRELVTCPDCLKLLRGDL